VLEVVCTILQIMDAGHLKPVILGEARNEITSQYLSPRKAGRLLGWAPEFTLESGLRRAVDWYRAYFQDGHGGQLR
jgi:nucleoside-diphosphate-sugar epimerase